MIINISYSIEIIISIMYFLNVFFINTFDLLSLIIMYFIILCMKVILILVRMILIIKGNIKYMFVYISDNLILYFDNILKIKPISKGL